MGLEDVRRRLLRSPPHLLPMHLELLPLPEWSNAVNWAALEAAGSSSRGSGWAPSGPVSPLGAPSQPELPGAP